jgi:hypothetical protein
MTSEEIAQEFKLIFIYNEKGCPLRQPLEYVIIFFLKSLSC